MLYTHTSILAKILVFLVTEYRERRYITCSFFYQGLSDINKNNQISSAGIFQLKLTTMAAKTCLKPIN